MSKIFYTSEIYRKYLFLYFTILCISIYIFNNINVSIVGLIIGFLIIMYIQEHYRNFKSELENFIYDIKEFQNVDKKSFNQLIDTINSIIELRNDVIKGVLLCSQNYDVAKDLEKKAINILESFKLSINYEKTLIQKLDNSADKLSYILSEYLNDIKDKCNNEIEKNGYNILKKRIYNYNQEPYEKNNFNF